MTINWSLAESVRSYPAAGKYSHWTLYPAVGYAPLTTEDTGGDDDWLNADDDQWEKNWNAQVSGADNGAAATTSVTKSKSQPASASNPNDFESYNPLSKVTAKPASKPKSNEDDLWDLLNN